MTPVGRVEVAKEVGLLGCWDSLWAAGVEVVVGEAVLSEAAEDEVLAALSPLIEEDSLGTTVLRYSLRSLSNFSLSHSRGSGERGRMASDSGSASLEDSSRSFLAALAEAVDEAEVKEGRVVSGVATALAEESDSVLIV